MNQTIAHGNIMLSSFNGMGAAYSFKNTPAKGESTVTTVKIDLKDKQGVIASWGKNNDYPQKIIAQVRKNGSASAGLRLLIKAHYGNGLVLIRKGVTEDGKHDHKIIDEETVPEIADFFERSHINKFMLETITDLEWWGIAFPEFILSNDFTKINRVKRHQAAWCRFEVMTEGSGLVENVYISQKFGAGGSVDVASDFVAKVPVIDSYWSAEEVREYCKANKIHRFIRPVFNPLVDEAYYPELEWHSVTKSGWLEVANSVPEFKMNMFKNQVSIKFLIEVDEQYFKNIYQHAWNDFKPEEQIEIRKALVDKINEHLSGESNAGKSIQSMMYIENGIQQSTIKITPIDDKFKDGSYLPEAEAANSEVLFAMGVDPSLIGAGIPGGKLGAGSGSDKNAAYNILTALFKTNRERTLDNFNFVRAFNGWERAIKAILENTILTTLDKNPTGSQKTT